MIVADVVFLSAAIVTLLALFLRDLKTIVKLRSRFIYAANSNSTAPKNEKEFFPLPASLPALNPATISSDKGGCRDHLYVNKVLRHPYHQTMSHQAMKSEDWIEIDSYYLSDLEAKRRIIAMQGKVVLDALDDDGIRLGCQELLSHLCEWLTTRYPGLFRWDSLADSRRTTLLNLATNDMVLVKDTSNGAPLSGEKALHAISRLVQDDFLIAAPSREKDGEWIVGGGVVAFPGFYLLSEKIGTSLFTTHAPVPQFNEKLLRSVERTLTRLKPDQPIERTSWEIVDHTPDGEQFWVPMAGSLPTSTGAKPMHDYHRSGRAENACETEDASKLLLRLDHQTFVKMPKSGVVFFGVHPFRRPLSELQYKPHIPKLLLDIHRLGPPDIMKYKGAPLYQDSVIPYLEQLHRWQVEHGFVKEGENPVDFRKYGDRHVAK